MVELADTRDLKSRERNARASSNLASATKKSTPFNVTILRSKGKLQVREKMTNTTDGALQAAAKTLATAGVAAARTAAFSADAAADAAAGVAAEAAGGNRCG